MRRLRTRFDEVDAVDAYLGRGLSATFVINIVGKVITFLVGVALARLLGPAHLGVYATAIAIAQLLRLPSVLGLPGVIVRYVSVYETQEHWSLMRGLLQRALYLTVSLSVVAAVIGSIVVFSLSGRLGEDKTLAFLLAVWMVPVLDFSVFRSAILQGLRRVVVAQIPDILLRPIAFLGLLIFVWQVADGTRLNAVLALQVYLFTAVLSFVVGIALLAHAVPKPVWRKPAETDFSRWRNSLAPFMLIYTAQLLLSQIDVLILSALSTDVAVGIYRVAWQGGEIVTFTLGIVNIVIQPMISRLHLQGDTARLQRMITQTTRLSTAIALPVALLLVVIGPWFLEIVFGAAYSSSYAPMAILVVGQLANVAAGSVGLLLFMTGHERDAAWAISLALILNILLDFSLIPAWGPEGAAIASAVSLVIWNIILLRRVRQCLGVHPTVFGDRLSR